MKNGFSFQEAMHVMEDEKNRKAFTEIRDRLDAGAALTDFFAEYLPASCRSYVSGFLMYLPFQEALRLGMAIAENEKKQKQSVIREMLYPVLLMCGMLAGIFLFCMYVLPKMLDLLEGFRVSSGSLSIVRTAAQTASAGLLILSALLSAAAVYLTRPARIASVYRFLVRHRRRALLIRFASEDFTRFFLECVRMNISTYHALQLLQKIPEKPLVGLIAQELDRMLSGGDSFAEAVSTDYVEPVLSRFFKTAFYASECEKMLEGYLQMSSVRTAVMIRRFSVTVQLISYSMIGSMIVFVYLIMMVPMQMLQSI